MRVVYPRRLRHLPCWPEFHGDSNLGESSYIPVGHQTSPCICCSHLQNIYFPIKTCFMSKSNGGSRNWHKIHTDRPLLNPKTKTYMHQNYWSTEHCQNVYKGASPYKKNGQMIQHYHSHTFKNNARIFDRCTFNFTNHMNHSSHLSRSVLHLNY